MFEIRKAGPGDVERIARIHAETWIAAYHDFIPADFLSNKAKLEPRRKMWNEFLSHEHDGHFVVADGGTIAGFFSISLPRDGDLPPDTLELDAIYFDRAYWHRGLGSLAMRFVIAQAKRRGCARVSLWVFRENAPAIAFYRKFGFRPDGKVNTLTLGKPVDECRYLLPLNGAKENT